MLSTKQVTSFNPWPEQLGNVTVIGKTGVGKTDFHSLLRALLQTNVNAKKDKR